LHWAAESGQHEAVALLLSLRVASWNRLFGAGCAPTRDKGRREKKGESKVTTFFGGVDVLGFFSRIFEPPFYETPKKRDKKNRAKQSREGEKKMRGKRPRFFLSPSGFVDFIFFPCFFNSPCETPKNTIKKSRGK
jgi:hypothetical protein